MKYKQTSHCENTNYIARKTIENIMYLYLYKIDNQFGKLRDNS